MKEVLGEAWHALPPALQAHYKDGISREVGLMDIEFPRFMRPYLFILHLMGALIQRAGRELPTVVERCPQGRNQQWHRHIQFPDGEIVNFDSLLTAQKGGRLIEFVNPVMGLQMVPGLIDGELHYHGECFVIQLGRWRLRIPEGCVLGHTHIVERAIDASCYSMDFRLQHPLLGQVFRYSGTFETFP